MVQNLLGKQKTIRPNQRKSNLLSLTCGIPQGSTLGPLLFLLHINDMPSCSTVMNEEFEKILLYCGTNKLSVNLKKTNLTLITDKKPDSTNLHC